MGNKVVRFDVNGKTLSVDDTEYKLKAGLVVLITQKHPRPTQYNSNDYKTYKSLVAQVKSFQNRTAVARPHITWKWKHMPKTVISAERIAAE